MRGTTEKSFWQAQDTRISAQVGKHVLDRYYFLVLGEQVA
jgi:hypothetical protein